MDHFRRPLFSESHAGLIGRTIAGLLASGKTLRAVAVLKDALEDAGIPAGDPDSIELEKLGLRDSLLMRLIKAKILTVGLLRNASEKRLKRIGIYAFEFHEIDQAINAFGVIRISEKHKKPDGDKKSDEEA